MKKEISALVLASMLLVSANAATPPEETNSTADVISTYEDRETNYTYLDFVGYSLSVAGTSANYSLDVEGRSSVTKISATMQLQKKNSSGTYANYGSSWSVSSSGSMLSKSGTKTVASGGTYRLKISITATTSSGSATETVYAY